MDCTLTIFSFLTDIIVRFTHTLVQSPHHRVAGSSKRLGTGSERLAGVCPVIRTSIMRGLSSVKGWSHFAIATAIYFSQLMRFSLVVAIASCQPLHCIPYNSFVATKKAQSQSYHVNSPLRLIEFIHNSRLIR